VHVDIVVIPERHDEDHAISEGVAHSLQAALCSKVVGVTEDGLLGLAEVVGDRVAADTSDVRCGLVEDLAALDVLAADLNKITVGSVVRGNELGDYCERLGSVDGLAGAVEGLVAHPEGVEITTVLVAVALVAVTIARATSCVRGASGVAGTAGMRSHSVGNAVGLPDIHLVAARAGSTETGVCVVGRCCPAVAVCLAFDELDVLGTLSITVSCSELGAGLVSGRKSTVCGHRHEVQSAVETTYSLCLALNLLACHMKYLHPILLTSTSKVNSWFFRLKSW
jgi:hypothetical protein